MDHMIPLLLKIRILYLINTICRENYQKKDIPKRSRRLPLSGGLSEDF